MRTSCGSCPISTRGARLALVSRAQVWRAGAEAKLGRLNWPPAPPGFRRGGISSPARAYALAAIAQISTVAERRRKRRTPLGKQLRRPRAGTWSIFKPPPRFRRLTLYKRRRFEAAAYAAFARGHPTTPNARWRCFSKAWRQAFGPTEALSPPSRNSSRICRVRSPPTLTCSSASSTTSLGAADKAVAQYDLMSRSERSATAASLSCSWRKSTTTASASRRRSLSIGSSSRRIPGLQRRAAVEDLLLTSYWLGDRGNPELAGGRGAVLEPSDRRPHPLGTGSPGL